MGIAVVSRFAFSDEVECGDVRVLLETFEPKPLPLGTVHASRHHVPPRVRAKIDFLAQELDMDPEFGR